MRRLPTDLEILQAVYELHFDDYVSFNPEQPNRQAKIYVPIDIRKIAQKLQTEEDIVFGRLYYHLDHRYGYKQQDNSDVNLFLIAIGATNPDRHCVNFPYAAAVLADLRYEHEKHRETTRLAVLSLVISALSFLISGVAVAVTLWPAK